MTYKASLDRMATAITVTVTIVFAALILRPVWLPSLGNNAVSTVVGIVLFVVYFLCLGLKPRGYTLTGSELVISRIFSNVHIPREDMETVEAFSQERRRAIRIFGVGGLFGYFGKYGVEGQGPMTWYVTRKDRMVLIALRGEKKIVISPDDRELFIEALRAS